ncbi:tRNA (guanosine(46)-N(7))-methyltransferase TrmB [Pleionea sp. CnH1-48]|uniref:tRNA (guanine(46)-N(7))-methyltransferase TrmB n=1 Tax=Pleionea sp. CnH1-48 TaxID=2954494 RepID=UPI0020981B42|nr:SAM-dependent methyltransferase [Pleionea sp. CnH1-48]MCO7226925.1 SAM-dependent methyltransferase [Pleionea sp. CnH1-48]
MFANSKEVSSNQSGLYEHLEKVVCRHRDSEYKKPIQAHNHEAFEQLVVWIDGRSKPLIMDSCCGTGMSTVNLAKQHPEHLVVGVDQSKVRITKPGSGGEDVPDNCLFLRANCEDVWRLCIEANLLFEKHYILYPNPWPKADHFKRRWHGHPVFSYLPRLSPYIHLRSNWPVYLAEFAKAWSLLGYTEYAVEELEVGSPLTLFEHKYHESGQHLYQLTVTAS